MYEYRRVFQKKVFALRVVWWISYREEWPRIRDDIDASKLAPMALIQTESLNIGDNHQILAYAYEQSGQEVRLFIYEPNEGQKEVEYRFNIAATSWLQSL